MQARVTGTMIVSRSRCIASYCPLHDIVSSIDSGAGSVGVSARPALPRTRSTSGNRLMIRSVACSS